MKTKQTVQSPLHSLGRAVLYSSALEVTLHSLGGSALHSKGPCTAQPLVQGL